MAQYVHRVRCWALTHGGPTLLHLTLDLGSGPVPLTITIDQGYHTLASAKTTKLKEIPGRVEAAARRLPMARKDWASRTISHLIRLAGKRRTFHAASVIQHRQRFRAWRATHLQPYLELLKISKELQEQQLGDADHPSSKELAADWLLESEMGWPLDVATGGGGRRVVE